jgi:hypothetical protein
MSNDSATFIRSLERHDAWRQLYAYFASEAALSFLYNLARDGHADRPAHARKPWRISHAIDSPFRHSKPRRLGMMIRNRTLPWTQVRYGFEFSSMGEGASIPPHTDAGTKLLSLMLYFPRNGAAGPVGTEFYAPRSGQSWATDWDTGLLTEEDTKRFFETHEAFYQTDFSRNVLFGFVKSDRSWHGLKPIEKAYAPRQSVNINYFLDD